MKRIDAFALTGILGSSIVLASFLVFATAYHVTAAASPQAPVQAPAKPMHMSWVITTGEMIGSDAGPAYVPANPSLPADSNVTITVTNFDDATALPQANERYATATGIVGPLTVETMDATNPNAPGTRTTAWALDPATGVSHTFTIPQLGINVPIAPKARTTFTIHTAKAGVYQWQCFDPCGGDPDGWGGAMATLGYMRGAMTLCGGCGSGGSGCC